MKILIAGPGNLGFHIAKRFIERGNEVFVWHYDTIKLREIGRYLQVPIVENLSLWSGDIVFITVRDDAIRYVSQLIEPSLIKIHCSGALPMNEIATTPRGVIYPLQSFVKTEPDRWIDIPVFITYEQQSKDVVQHAARILSPKVIEITDEQRHKIHLAAVMVNNFVNFTLGMANKYINKEGLSTNWFLPLLNKTVGRFQRGEDPLAFQTGPARRHDIKTLNKHLKLLMDTNDQTLYEFYKVVSDIISRYYDSEKRE
ncbi:MAG: DUF2520 domain-containing protein [Chlorobi bacterium]|nr:DUF2520 domain-containing protein [Chlorobiota bacterium]